MFDLKEFVRESNRIEGINREPTAAEIDAHDQFCALRQVALVNLEWFVNVVEPGARLRSEPGLNVRVGNHIPPAGGPDILVNIRDLLENVNTQRWSPFAVHMAYETLHPFTDGNGRSGRVLWLWQMGGIELASLGFLHHFYYQTLEAQRA